VTRALWVVVAAACAAVYISRLDHVVGLVVDDAWYVVLAKALHSGAGYRLISSAADPILPAVPPGFPAVLSLLWAIEPRFPDNVLLMKSVSIASMFALAMLSYRYVAVVFRDQVLAIAVSIATFLTPAFVFLATSTVMPECLFAATQMAAVFALDRRTPSTSRGPVVIAALLTAAAILLRSAGVAVAAAGLFTLLYARAWRHAALFMALVLLCVAPWMIYSRLNAPTADQQRAHGGSIAYSYGQLLSMREAGLAGAGPARAADLPARVWTNTVDLFGRGVGALIVPVVYRGADESGVEVFAIGGVGARVGSMGVAAGTIALSLTLSIVVLIGLLATARREGMQSATALMIVTPVMILLVPPHSALRYLLPLAPLILLYFFAGIGALAAVAAPAVRSGAALRVVSATVILLFALDHLQYVLLTRSGAKGVWLADYAEVTEMTTWMNGQLPADGAVASTNPGLIYLLTGRHAVALDDAPSHWERWRESGVRYAVATRAAEKPPTSLGYRLVYESARQKLWILDIAAGQPGLQKTGSSH
jgi:hypothetical protein